MADAAYPHIVPFSVEPTAIDGLLLITMKQVTDERGTVRELFRVSAFVDAGLGTLGPFHQINATATAQGGMRGLHAEAMSKLVSVVAGEAFGAYVDLRVESASLGAVVTVRLVPGVQVYVPNGVGNGFQAVAPGVTEYVYCFDQEWAPGMAGQACNPLDPALGIEWPLPIDRDDRAQISEKDLNAPMYADVTGAPR
jgi:dTDP-4-dehydrorhamnose 3,5-epimerase